MQRNYSQDKPLGYQQIVGLAAATALTPPAGTVICIITPETQAVRWRDDGVDPTAAIGYPLAVGIELECTIQVMTAIKFIQQVASATLNISYYGAPL